MKQLEGEGVAGIPRLFSKKELRELHDRLKAGDESALEAWGAYFRPLCNASAGAAVKKVKGRPYHPDRFHDLSDKGWTVAMDLGRDLIKKPDFVLNEIENYVWRSVRNAINKEDEKDRLFVESHKSSDYQSVKSTGAAPLQTTAITSTGKVIKLRKGCEDIFENNVIRLLAKHKGNEKEVAKILERAIHVVRDTRYLVEERILRQKRSICAVTQPVPIEPESLESMLLIDRELEEIEQGCTDSDREVLRLLANNSDVKVAEILGVDKKEIIWARGRIAKQYAKRKREEGNPMPWLEKLAKTWLAYRPRHKQSNDWPKVRPKGSKAKGSKVATKQAK